MTTLRQCPNLEIAKFDSEWLVLNVNNCTVTKLNEMGGYILTLLEKPHTVETLITSLRDTFEDVESSAQNKIKTYLQSLQAIGLVECAVL